jgi:hypothetical protein
MVVRALPQRRRVGARLSSVAMVFLLDGAQHNLAPR